MGPGDIFALLVLLIGVPAMFVHKTAAVLVGAWLFNMAAYLLDGTPLPIPSYILSDVVAVVLIMSWRTTLADYLVLGIYPICWVIYAVGFAGMIEPVQQYWALYALALAQFVIAGPWPSLSGIKTFEGRRIFPKWRRLLVANQHIGYDHDK